MNQSRLSFLLLSLGIASAMTAGLISMECNGRFDLAGVRGGTIYQNFDCMTILALFPAHTCECENNPADYFTCAAAPSPGGSTPDAFCSRPQTGYTCSGPTLPCGTKLNCDPYNCDDRNRKACTSEGINCPKLYGCTRI